MAYFQIHFFGTKKALNKYVKKCFKKYFNIKHYLKHLFKKSCSKNELTAQKTSTAKRI